MRVYPGAQAAIRQYIRIIRGEGQDSPQLWVRLDDQIQLLHDVDDCLDGKIPSGSVDTELHHKPVPGAQEVSVAYVRINRTSGLKADQISALRACLNSVVVGRIQPIKDERYSHGFVTTMKFSWPLEQSDTFQFLATGHWPSENP